MAHIGSDEQYQGELAAFVSVFAHLFDRSVIIVSILFVQYSIYLLVNVDHCERAVRVKRDIDRASSRLVSSHRNTLSFTGVGTDARTYSIR